MSESFHDVISTTRSIRRYRTDPIPDDVLDRVLQALVGDLSALPVVNVRAFVRS